MSFATNLMFSNIATGTRLNSEFAVMKANQGIQNLASKSIGADVVSLHNQEKQLIQTSLLEALKAKIAAAVEESLKKKQDSNIKKSFNIPTPEINSVL